MHCNTSFLAIVNDSLGSLFLQWRPPRLLWKRYYDWKPFCKNNGVAISLVVHSPPK